MKLRLTQAGWETYTSNFGGVEFVDGLSVDDCTGREAARLGNIVQCVLEDGTNPSSSQAAIDAQCIPMAVRGDQITRTAAVVADLARTRTKEELEAIAGEKGIKGLREIGDPLGVKASGIADLIELIVAAQKKTPEPVAAEVVAAVAEVVPPVPAEVVVAKEAV
jgi:hypothetical protein